MFRMDPGYYFIERYFSLFEEYLSYMDMQLSKNDQDGVIFVTSGAERNHLRFDPTTTLVVYVLRSYYEGAIEKAPQETEVLMTSGAINSLVNELGLSTLSKRLSPTTIASALRVLDGFNIVTRANNSYGDPSYSFYIMPTIRYVISSEKLNALYTMLNAPEEQPSSSTLFDQNQGGNLWRHYRNSAWSTGTIFATGPNGTGKSTINDALQVIILGTTRPDNFNKAANEKGRSGRNLISYLRGQTGVKDDNSTIVLRKGVFTSYIAIEIYDDVNDKTFTLGACFDVDSTDKIDKHYFFLDSPFPEHNFLKKVDGKSIPMNYKDLSADVRENYKVNHFRFFDTDAEYQKFAKEAFGNLPDKYFSLFKKAVSFAPISNISSFITEYICDADLNVDITPMQKIIEQYKILENEAKNLKGKVDALAQIHDTFEEYTRFVKRQNMLNYVSARVDYEENKKRVDDLAEAQKKANNRLLIISDEINRIDAEMDSLNHDLNSYNAKILQSDNYSLTEKLSLKKDGLSRQITQIQMNLSTV